MCGTNHDREHVGGWASAPLSRLVGIVWRMRAEDAANAIGPGAGW